MKDEALKLALKALEQTLQTLDDENAKPGGAIADTIWHSEHETLFDYLGSEITAIKEALTQPEQETVAWPCVIAEANFEQNTITLEMQCSNYKVSAGKHWLSTTPPQPAQEPWREFASDYERGVIDGRQKQAQSSVDKAVNRMAQRPWVDLTEKQIEIIEEMALTKQWAIRMTIEQLKECNA